MAKPRRGTAQGVIDAEAGLLRHIKVGNLSQIKAPLCTVGNIGTDKPGMILTWLVIFSQYLRRFRRDFFVPPLVCAKFSGG